MIQRIAEHKIRNLSQQFPVLVLSGPRQSGKTTLIRMMFPELPYFNLENPATLARFQDDPEGCLSGLPEGRAIIDEAQRFPELASWLQIVVDENPQAGRFFLTGSNQPLLRTQVNQSLAGRAAYFYLSPFTMDELGELAPKTTDELLYKGMYPPLYDRPFTPSDWYAQYVHTYLERDLTLLLNIKDLQTFFRFLRLCAGRSGQVLNLSDLARDADVSHTTIRNWLSVLEASYLIFFLHPWHENYGKRLTKSPKIYFFDTGLAGWLAGIQHSDQWQIHPLRGAFFETLIVSEHIKTARARGDNSAWYYWNSPEGPEIDLLKDEAGLLTAYEIKSGQTFRPEQLKALQRWAELSKTPAERLYLLYQGEEEFTHNGIQIRNWRHSPALI